MNEKFVRFVTTIYQKNPILRPYMAFIHKTFFLKPTFFGGGMKTNHELPWNDEYDWDVFRKTNTDVKKYFEFTKNPTGMNSDNLDTLLWRHWIVSYSVRHAIEFADGNDPNFVECGVGDGVTAFFALREISSQEKVNSKFTIHLYDSWDAMRKERLFESEFSSVGGYANLNINTTKKNLAEFNERIIYHQGYIPESFSILPESPNSIIYLSIDLNSANATLSTLNFFFPRLVRGGVILFDDYGALGHSETKKLVDIFFSDKPGTLMKLPTGQAIYYR